MFRIEFAPAILPTLQFCLDNFHALRAAQQGVWEKMNNPLITQRIQDLWAEIIPKEPAQAMSLSPQSTLSLAELKDLLRAMECHIHINDGRYCATLACLDDVIQRHSNPFALRQAFAHAENDYQSSGAGQIKQSLQELRMLTLGIKHILENKPHESPWRVSTECHNAHLAWIGSPFNGGVAASC